MATAVPLLSPGVVGGMKTLALLDFFYNKIKVLSLTCVLTSDHDHTDASSPAQLDGARNLLTRRVEHANTAHKGQVSLEEKRKKNVSFT